MQCKMLVVSSELEERSDMRESREIEVVIWVLEKCSMKVVSGGMACAWDGVRAYVRGRCPRAHARAERLRARARARRKVVGALPHNKKTSGTSGKIISMK